MTGRELDRKFVERLRTLQLAIEHDGEETCETYVHALLDEACAAIHRGCTRVDVLRAMSNCAPDPHRVDPWVEVASEDTRPDVPSAKPSLFRFWPWS